MWQIFLIPFSILLLVSTLIPSLREAARAKGANEPEDELKTIYPEIVYPTWRK
jgi:hypothetical protein